MAASLDRETALKRIAELLVTGKRPATFLIGAGCSVNAGIPAAGKMVAELRRDFTEHCSSVPPNAPNVYGEVMACLSPDQRRDYILSKIDAARLNWGHIALGQLMASKYVTRVLSVNFDQLLSRANGLIGHYPAIYDFGAAPSDSVRMIAEPCIIHLHGQSTGFVLFNTVEETQVHVAKLKRVIADSVENSPVVIIGYSGGSDGVMEALSAAYTGNAPLYWIGYEGEPSKSIAALLEKSRYASYTVGGDADLFLVDLAREVERRKPSNAWPPKVFSDPVQHLLDEVKPVGEMPVTDKDTENYLAGWRADMASLRVYHGEKFGLGRKVETAQMQGDNVALQTLAAAEKKGGGVDGPAAKAASRAEYWAHVTSGNANLDAARATAGAQAHTKFEAAIIAYESAVAIDSTPHEALNNWGATLAAMARVAAGAEQQRLFTEACAKYDAALKIKPYYHEALSNWGNTLAHMARVETGAEQQRLFSEACAKYDDALKIKPDKPQALNNWGNALLAMAGVAAGAEQQRLFSEAQQKLEQCEGLAPGHARYNLACLAALQGGQADICHAHLKASHAAGKLPTRAHLDADRDLDSVRGLPWFDEIRQLARAE